MKIDRKNVVLALFYWLIVVDFGILFNFTAKHTSGVVYHVLLTILLLIILGFLSFGVYHFILFMGQLFITLM